MDSAECTAYRRPPPGEPCPNRANACPKSSTCASTLAGRRRSWHQRYGESQTGGALRYLGSLPLHDVLGLYMQSELVLNPCTTDSPSRMTLEAMQMGAPVIAPPHVPEFAGLDPVLIASSDCPVTLADQVEEVWKDEKYPIGYDFRKHDPKNVVGKARRIFDELLNS